MNLETQQSFILDTIFQNYNFGENIQIESSSGWSFDPVENTYVKPVFYYDDTVKSLDPDSDTSLKCYLTVRFNPLSTLIQDVYAIDQNGQIFGSLE